MRSNVTNILKSCVALWPHGACRFAALMTSPPGPTPARLLKTRWRKRRSLPPLHLDPRRPTPELPRWTSTSSSSRAPRVGTLSVSSSAISQSMKTTRSCSAFHSRVTVFLTVPFFMGELKGEMEMDGIYCSDWQFRGSHELKSGSDSAGVGGLIPGSWEQRRNIAAGLSVIFCSDFRGKKWVVAPASSSSSEAVNFTGRQTVLICWRIKWRKPLSVIKRWSVPLIWCFSGFSFCQRVRESPPAAAKLRRLQSLQRGGEHQNVNFCFDLPLSRSFPM